MTKNCFCTLLFEHLNDIVFRLNFWTLVFWFCVDKLYCAGRFFRLSGAFSKCKRFSKKLRIKLLVGEITFQKWSINNNSILLMNWLLTVSLLMLLTLASNPAKFWPTLLSICWPADCWAFLSCASNFLWSLMFFWCSLRTNLSLRRMNASLFF